MGTSDDRTINEWTVKSAIKMEFVLRKQNSEGKRYNWVNLNSV